MISFCLDTFELRFIGNWDFSEIRFKLSNPPDDCKVGSEGGKWILFECKLSPQKALEVPKEPK